MVQNTRGKVTFRWLGVAGIELQVDNAVLLVDPYVTRISFRQMWLGRVQPDRALVREKVPRGDFVLVTHAHFDHLLDVPEVVLHTGAAAYGSPNSCRLLAACGVPPEKVHPIGAGDRLQLGPFQVEMSAIGHGKAPGFGPGLLRAGLRPPLRARDYRMDTCLTFLITAGGQRLLTNPGERSEGARPAEVLFLYPSGDTARVQTLLQQVRPRVAIPLHWDDLNRPLSQPLRPLFAPPRLGWPPLRRIDLAVFREQVEQVDPSVTVLIPESFRPYELSPGAVSLQS
jgi:L-ascorbate metabolism protein UlaG (beta-lactamase superfamily)